MQCGKHANCMLSESMTIVSSLYQRYEMEGSLILPFVTVIISNDKSIYDAPTNHN